MSALECVKSKILLLQLSKIQTSLSFTNLLSYVCNCFYQKYGLFIIHETNWHFKSCFLVWVVNLFTWSSVLSVLFSEGINAFGLQLKRLRNQSTKIQIYKIETALKYKIVDLKPPKIVSSATSQWKLLHIIMSVIHHNRATLTDFCHNIILSVCRR